MSVPRIMFYVQYLLGIGHVRRSSLIVQALCEQGAHVDVIFGGMPVPSMSFGSATMHQLTAVKSADAGFSGLVKADHSLFSDEDKEQRTQALLALCDTIQPDLIVTETYPFGRRQMRFELLPLLEWVKSQPNPPILTASIRDILQRRAIKREQECVDLVQANYQHVLVHGDEKFYPLEKSFPFTDVIADKVSYSGYVCPLLPDDIDDRRRDTIVVSIGGGSVGKEVLNTAIALFKTGFAADKHWLLVTGPNMNSGDKAYFKAQQQDNLQVVDLADDFLKTLSNAYVSISMAGYNTVMDLLLTKVPAVVVPFEGEGETEQLARSEVLAQGKVLQLVKYQDLNVETLKNAINNTLACAAESVDINSQGATESARLLIEWATPRSVQVEQGIVDV
ncbi:MAG: glycosyltransferase [Moritella sp.]|uniref:glycosyltransferase family protein n=1 Tax=Moritella sp. TaxID=78556 RepID=UPI0029AEBE46|nr:glycosyltransferase [Moritella sp.]MDX2320191.1 glycosyltransferase [Moritella sp.]